MASSSFVGLKTVERRRYETNSFDGLAWLTWLQPIDWTYKSPLLYASERRDEVLESEEARADRLKTDELKVEEALIDEPKSDWAASCNSMFRSAMTLSGHGS
jgi:hypothetical protein